jgi:hypothetical protein
MDLDNPLRYVNGAACRPAQIVCTDTILFLHTYWHKCMMKQVIYLSLQWMPTCKITKKKSYDLPKLAAPINQIKLYGTSKIDHCWGKSYSK